MSREILPFDERIVVTGYGGVSPLGLDAETTFEKIVQGESGITELPDHLTGNPYNVHTIAMVKNFDGNLVTDRTGILKKELRKIHLSGQYALVGAAEALQRAGLAAEGTIQLKRQPGVDNDRVGVNIGSGIAGAETLIEIDKMIERGREILPSVTLRALPDRVATIPGRNIRAMGPSASMVGACATGAMSTVAGIRVLRLREADIMVVGSFEAQATKWAEAMFDGMTALDRETDPAKASRPFDQSRPDEKKGFVLGEGGGALILERESSAIRRGAKIYAEVAGYAETNDASDDDTLLDGVGSAKALARAVKMSGDFNRAYINAHATGTKGDRIEFSEVIAKVLSPDVVAGVSSTKGASGHMVGGAGSAESIIGIQALNSGWLPPSLKISTPIAGSEAWNFVRDHAQHHPDVDIVFKNSFGFGGINVVLAFRKYRERLQVSS